MRRSAQRPRPDRHGLVARSPAIVQAAATLRRGVAEDTREIYGRGTLDVVHPAVRTVADALAAAGATGQVRELDQRAATAAAAAAVLNCEIGAIANSLVFVAETAQHPEPVLVLASGAHRVDTDLVARLVQAERLRRADPEFVRTHTGQSIGGVAPVGHPTRLRTVVDVDLAGYPVVWAAAGHPHAVFATTFEELVRITGGTPAQVAAAASVDPRGQSGG